MLFVSKNSEQLGKFPILLIMCGSACATWSKMYGHIERIKNGTAAITSAIDCDMNSTCQLKPAGARDHSPGIVEGQAAAAVGFDPKAAESAIFQFA